MKRVYEVVTVDGPFFFFADSKVLAVDHANHLCSDPSFPKIMDASVRFVCWKEDGTL